jgi:hypothetical protein
MSSSLGGPGKNLLLTASLPGSATPAPSLNIFALDLFNGSNATATLRAVSGYHVLTYACGAGAVDHLYIDGIETTNYTFQNASGTCSAQSSGNLYLSGNSAAPWSGTSGFLGTIYGFAASTDTHTAAQVLVNSALLKSATANKGVPTSVQQSLSFGPQFTVAGDSLTCGFSLATPCTNTVPSPNTWPQNLTLTNQPTYTMNVNAITGISVWASLGSESERACAKLRTTNGASVYATWLGTNEFTVVAAGSTVAQNAMATWQKLIALKNIAVGCGATHTFVGTMISRGGNDPAGNSFDADKNELNRLILSQWRQQGFTGVLPFGEQPTIGADGTSTNTGLYSVDQIHLLQVGQNLLFPLGSNAINYVFGASAGSPHVVSSVPYTMVASDGFITLSGLSAGGNITANTCLSPIGVTFTINNPQSAQAVTWTPLSGELANGSSAAITIPSNGYLKATSVPLPPSTAGCTWSIEKGTF